MPLRWSTTTAPTPLRDRLGRGLRDLRISVIDRCNFRCSYCMPDDRFPREHRFLGTAEHLTFEEIARFARIFAGLGVHKLRLTGGEPLLRRGLADLVRRLAAVPGIDDIAMTTNGSLLADKAGDLRRAGLGRITLSLDSMSAATFREIAGGRGDIGVVFDAIRAAEDAGFSQLKINCVVMRGRNDDGVIEMVDHFRGSGHIVRFIEYMDVGTCNDWHSTRVVPSAELHERINSRWPLLRLPAHDDGEVAERFAFADGAGEIGFISSITQPFCGACSRARLSADGRLYTCLFVVDGRDLRGPLRDGADDAELAAIITSTWHARGDRYSEQRGERSERRRARVEMYTVGG